MVCVTQIPNWASTLFIMVQRNVTYAVQYHKVASREPKIQALWLQGKNAIFFFSETIIKLLNQPYNIKKNFGTSIVVGQRVIDVVAKGIDGDKRCWCFLSASSNHAKERMVLWAHAEEAEGGWVAAIEWRNRCSIDWWLKTSRAHWSFQSVVMKQ